MQATKLTTKPTSKKQPQKPTQKAIKPTSAAKRAIKPAPKTCATHSIVQQIISVLALPLWVAVVLYACQYAITFGLYFIIGRALLTNPVWTTICNALIYAISLFLIIWLPIKLFHCWQTSRKELGLNSTLTWTDLGLAPIGFIVYLLLAAIIVSIFSLFPFFDPEQAQELGYSALNSGLDRIVAFFALCIVAPVAEEIIFRGWLYGKLRAKISGRTKSLLLSIFITSLTFGILHGQWNVGVNVFAMSIVLCALREITGTIHSGVILHILKNSIAFVIVYILGTGFLS